ncbi:MAG TPA: TetR/AcrR family transcriptional regulator [bacterium]|nr:TetR/AcrR family transcriptional regulator [bacterium]
MPRVAAEVRVKREGARRTQILEAAAYVFSRKGFDGATVSEIARAAKLSEGSIYNYFRSKEDLLIHIPQHLVQPVLVPLVEAVPVPRSSEETERLLTVMAQAMVDRVRAQAPFLKVFLSALPSLSLSARRQYMQLLPTYAAEALERFLREGIRRGVVRRDINPVIAARVLPGMLLMFLMTQEVLLGRQLISYGYDEIVPEAVRLFLYGAVPRDAAPRTGHREGGRT